MAIKMMDKRELQYTNGYLHTKDGTMVSPNGVIVEQYNMLETAVQKQIFIQQNDLDKDPKPVVTTYDFERESEWGVMQPNIKVETPALDAQVEQSLAVAEELEMLEKAEACNTLLSRVADLYEWADSGMVMVDDEPSVLHRFDGKHIVDPLSIDTKLIDMYAVFAATGKLIHDEDEEEADE